MFTESVRRRYRGVEAALFTQCDESLMTAQTLFTLSGGVHSASGHNAVPSFEPWVHVRERLRTFDFWHHTCLQPEILHK